MDKIIIIPENTLINVINLLTDYADAINGNKCMPKTAFDMLSKSGDVKLFINYLESLKKNNTDDFEELLKEKFPILDIENNVTTTDIIDLLKKYDNEK
jgi:hypothetical protein